MGHVQLAIFCTVEFYFMLLDNFNQLLLHNSLQIWERFCSCCNGAAEVTYDTLKFYFMLMSCFCITLCRSGKDFVAALMTMVGEILLVHLVSTKMVDAHVTQPQRTKNLILVQVYHA